MNVKSKYKVFTKFILILISGILSYSQGGYMRKMTRSEAGKLGYTKTCKTHQERYKRLQEDYNLNPVRCKNCDDSICYEKRRNRFCSHSCAASFNNLGKPRNFKKDTYSRPNVVCLNCQKTTENEKFCSNECCQKHKWNESRQEMESSGVAPGKVSAKRYFTDTEGYKCRECGIVEWQGKQLSLILDHINGNADDWRLENLRLLCPNCDSQTPTFKGRNMGNGRYYRRQRYKEGRSY
jgi:hypothetical protein